MRGHRCDATEWQIEPKNLRTAAERDALRRALTTTHVVGRVEDNLALRRAIVERPDDDEPRRAYAAWFRGQPQEMAQSFAGLIEAQLAVAAAYRRDPRADVTHLQSLAGPRYASIAVFRWADPLRRWLIEDLRLLLGDGLVGWPQFYRGAVERVTMRARRFLEIGAEVFGVAPIRHLVLTEVPEVARDLAQSPLLARIRSLSLPSYGRRDLLADEQITTLLESPHLPSLAHLRLVHQRALTERSYERIATAVTLPRLSCVEVLVTCAWSENDPEPYAPLGRRERMLTRDSTRSVRRARRWTQDLEDRLGHMPCLHPELYYRADYLDLESVTEHPIACDPRIMGHRGRHLAGPSPESASL